jgi:hypothetical protein
MKKNNQTIQTSVLVGLIIIKEQTRFSLIFKTAPSLPQLPQ